MLINIVLAGMGVRLKGLHVVYSIFSACGMGPAVAPRSSLADRPSPRGPDVVIGSTLGLYSFHSGYKGVATADSGMMRKHLGIQALLIILEFLMSVLNVLNWNGWTRLSDAMAAGSSVGPFWTFSTVLESLLWTGAYLVSAVAWYHVQQVRCQRGPRGARGQDARSARRPRSAQLLHAVRLEGPHGLRATRPRCHAHGQEGRECDPQQVVTPVNEPPRGSQGAGLPGGAHRIGDRGARPDSCSRFASLESTHNGELATERRSRQVRWQVVEQQRSARSAVFDEVQVPRPGHRSSRWAAVDPASVRS